VNPARDFSLSRLFLPLATPAERRLRFRVLVIPPLILLFTLGTVSLAGLNVIPKSALLGLPLIWLLLIYMLFNATRLAAAHYDGRKFIRSIEYRLCPACCYDLQSLAPSLTCPECGTMYTPEQLRERWEKVYARLAMKPGS